MVPGGAGPSSAVVDAVGYAGGAVLALCLLPQVAKIIIVRSARDISVAWSVMYLAGLALSITYLIMKDAMAAWLPMVLEVIGCLLILALKLFYEHTEAGRRFSSAKQPMNEQLDGSVRGGLSLTRSLSGAGRSHSLDKSWHGSPDASFGHHQQQQPGLPATGLEIVCEGSSSSSSSSSNNSKQQRLEGAAASAISPATAAGLR